MARWLLPENIADVLPEQARAVERLRRALLDLFAGYGYELVIPPLLEHLDSLLTGSGHDLELRTLKLVDQLSGRTLGLRADTTPQVARIDSHILNRSGVARLCYAGPTLHARPMHPMASREPLQVGAELYGEAGLAADREIIELAVRSARIIGTAGFHLDLGHTGVVRALLGDLPAADQDVDAVLGALTAKDPAALGAAVAGMEPATGAALQALLRLNGDTAEVLARARATLPANAGVARALADLEELSRGWDGLPVSVDLADLHGFRYHTGATFAIYAPGLAGPLLRGGRYDSIGSAFGRSRPATGFSLLDLREAARIGGVPRMAGAIRAPRSGPPGLEAAVEALRARGEVVIRSEPAVALGVALAVDRELAWDGSAWSVRATASPAAS